MSESRFESTWMKPLSESITASRIGPV
jgi:hypothetical protein